jgi:hypothetical protein
MRRAEVLQPNADLFIHCSGAFSDDQIDLFDDVMVVGNRGAKFSRPGIPRKAREPVHRPCFSYQPA